MTTSQGPQRKAPEMLRKGKSTTHTPHTTGDTRATCSHGSDVCLSGPRPHGGLTYYLPRGPAADKWLETLPEPAWDPSSTDSWGHSCLPARSGAHVLPALSCIEGNEHLSPSCSRQGGQNDQMCLNLHQSTQPLIHTF